MPTQEPAAIPYPNPIRIAFPVKNYLAFLPTIQQTPAQSIWLTYDAEADVLYINFAKPSLATDSELTDDDVVVRYAGEEVIGLTVLNASQRTA